MELNRLFSALLRYILCVIVEDHNGSSSSYAAAKSSDLDAPVVETFFPSERRLNRDDAIKSDHLLALGLVGLLGEWV